MTNVFASLRSGLHPGGMVLLCCEFDYKYVEHILCAYITHTHTHSQYVHPGWVAPIFNAAMHTQTNSQGSGNSGSYVNDAYIVVVGAAVGAAVAAAAATSAAERRQVERFV